MVEFKIAGLDEMPGVFALRREVFIVEQYVPESEELDSADETAVHIAALEDGEVIGCGRIIITESDAHIGRIAVKKCRRGIGIGAELCRFIVEVCRCNGCGNVWLNSQLHAVGFYEKLGFKPDGGIFTEAGIEHVKMVLMSDGI